jgi:CheY-like chemotaxis protein
MAVEVMPMRVVLVHGDAAEAAARAERLRAAGHAVDLAPLDGAAALRFLRERPPEACVIDLSRRPSFGRDLALTLRSTKATRQAALVFVVAESENEPESLQRLRALLPDATYTTWRAVRGALKRARTPARPVVPASRLAGYSGTPLPRKLGVKAGMTVGLIDAPDGFEATLGALPPGARLVRAPRGRCDLLVWFAVSRAEVEQRVAAVREHFGDGGLWIAWRKQGAPGAGDLTQADVRRIGLARGLVDYKICAIDAVWSGLKFARRRQGVRAGAG